MARPLRPEVDNGFWHAWNRGNEKHDIVRSDEDRIRFRELLAETVRRFGWNLISWVLMTNHFTAGRDWNPMQSECVCAFRGRSTTRSEVRVA